MHQYPVDLTKLKNGDVMVRFPDIPEAITYGESEKHALEQAKDALIVALSGYNEEGRDIPKPSRPYPGQKTVSIDSDFVEGTGKDTIPWRELFPELEDEPEYSVILRAARNRSGLTQVELSEKTGIPQGHISSMENGEIEIGEDRAKVLGVALNIDHKVFL